MNPDTYNIMDKLNRLENDQFRLDEIQHIEKILKRAKKTYITDYNNVTENIVSPVVEKLKSNYRIKKSS